MLSPRRMLLAVGILALSQSWFSQVFGDAAGSVWQPAPGAAVPEPLREFRGVWLATVYNLDWPSKPGLPVETQKEELIEIFDRLASLHINAIVLQVRTMCDAFYDSPIEPWSYYLTGEMGRPPEPFYDPLAFAVKEAHARGLELHAWFNPFRATTGLYGDTVPDSHISREYPWLIRKAQSADWLDPSSEFVRDRIITVIFDVIHRYDVDGVHLDDYFYPYPNPKDASAFDDAGNWERYRLTEGLRSETGMSQEDWRREAVNDLIERLYAEIKRHKPQVKFGISPFGIWRPGHPEGITGLDSWGQIYADSRKWVREGWLDYFSPQLYWKTGGPQDFQALFGWWQEQNLQGRHLWPGIAASRIGKGGEGDGREAADVLEQIGITREHPGRAPASGQLFWRWEAFATNRGGLSRMITKERYAEKAIPPPSFWLAPPRREGATLPQAADLVVTEKRVQTNGKEEVVAKLVWKRAGSPRTRARWWVVQVRRGKNKWATERLLPAGAESVEIEDFGEAQAVAIRSLDPYGELSEARVFSIPPGRNHPGKPPVS